MKRICILCAFLACLTASKAQYGYNYCPTINTTIQMGDSLLLNLDGDNVPTAVIRTYVDPTDGRTARLWSLKPNSGSTYMRDVKFWTDGVGINNVRVFADNDQIGHSTTYNSTGPYIFRENVASNFGPNTSGYVAYTHDWFNTITSIDSPEYLCTGWIKLSVGATLDSVRVIAACGCDPQGIVAGQSPTYATSISEIPSDQVRLVYDGRHASLLSSDPHLSYAMYDVLGRRVLNKKLYVGQNAIDLSSCPRGIIIIAVQDEAGRTMNVYRLANDL